MREPWFNNPVAHVQFVPVDKVEPNDWNPNSVAPNEMRLLHISIAEDGYTQPVVVSHDAENDRYVIIDGFHRWSIMRTCKDIWEANQGMLPVVVLDKTVGERMAATIRHNRARGKHAVMGMVEIVFDMLAQTNEAGERIYDDAMICNQLGLSPEELLRYKHVSGYSKIYADHEFNRAWETARQTKLRKDYESSDNPDDAARSGEAILAEPAQE